MPPADELTAALHAIRERVRARHPSGSPEYGVSLPDLMPLVHARDAAQGKVAAIGTVNPRPSGILHAVLQMLKRGVARCLDWHVREQVEFNRNMVACVNATLETLGDVNRALAELSTLRRDAEELKDIRSHWAEWSRAQEDRLFRTEHRMFQSVADAHAALQQRLTVAEQGMRLRDAAEERSAAEWRCRVERDIAGVAEEQRRAGEQRHSAWQSEWEQRFWEHMRQVRADFDRLVHTELRVIRQRMAGPAVAGPPLAEAAPAFDAAMFAERFRGTEADVAGKQRLYIPWFAGCRRCARSRLWPR